MSSSTNPQESQVLQDWLDFIHTSALALNHFMGAVREMAVNGNRECNPGDLNIALLKLNAVIGDAWADDATQDLDTLHMVVTGEGLPKSIKLT